MYPPLQRAIMTGERTLALAERLRDAAVSMAPRQAAELATFLSAFGTRLKEAAEDVARNHQDGRIGEIVALEYEVDRALRFVDLAFVQPRTQGPEQRILGAADRFCVEGFRFFPALRSDEYRGPVGPLVAVEASRSPAIWNEGDALPIPSLLTAEPLVFRRREPGVKTGRKLPRFPLVFLPGNLTQSPADLPLLSHEVGHAVDTSLELSRRILDEIESSSSCYDYWRAWMREMVADAVGILLSGEGFVASFCSYTRFLGLPESLTSGSDYPGYSLRLEMMVALLRAMRAPHADELCELVSSQTNPGRRSAEFEPLRERFVSEVLPAMEKTIFSGDCLQDWAARQRNVWRLAEVLQEWAGEPGIEDRDWKELFDRYRPLEYRDLPSILAIFRFLTGSDLHHDTLFECIYGKVFDASRPDWLDGASQWNFREKDLPSLRPTILGESGIKVPPTELLAEYDRVTFVGATNGQLVKSLEKAFEARKAPWEELEFFFASDGLLAFTERDDLPTLAEKTAEREKAKKEIRAFLEKKEAAIEWCFREFDGPPAFGSFWDVDEPGGRIHVSAQIPGLDIRRCPATDLVWSGELPTAAYNKYREGLVALRDRHEAQEERERSISR